MQDVEKSSEIVKFISSKAKGENSDETQTSTSSSFESYENGKESQRQLPWLRQCRIISHRAILNFLRAPNHYLIELFILIVIGAWTNFCHPSDFFPLFLDLLDYYYVSLLGDFFWVQHVGAGY